MPDLARAPAGIHRPGFGIVPLPAPSRHAWVATVIHAPLLRVIEAVYVVVAVMFLLGAFEERPGESGNPQIYQVIFLSFYLYPTYWVITHPLAVLEMLWRQRFMALYLAWAGLSIQWSEMRDISMRRYGALLGLTFFGIYFALRFPLRRQLTIIYHCCLACLALNLLVLASPGYSWYDDERFRAFRGVFAHKNQVAVYAVVGVISTLAQFALGEMKRAWFGYALIAIYTLQLLQSQSATSLAVLMMLLYFYFANAIITRIIPYRTWSRWVINIATTLLITFMILGPDYFLASLGRDSTLTGRTELWTALIGMGNRHFLYGFGFNGFWNGFDGPSREIWNDSTFDWHPAQAHDGLLDIFIQLGFIGVVLIITWLVDLVRTVPQLATGLSSLLPRDYLKLTLVFILFYDITESFLAASNSFYWFMLVVVSVNTVVWRLLQRAAAEETAMQPPAPPPVLGSHG
jgi:O-antigen ligase